MPEIQEKLFEDIVTRHPGLRFCPGRNCEKIVHTSEPKPNNAQRVHCTSCDTTYCFTCGLDYHAPTECKDIKEWKKKAEADSGTAQYLTANTKECPKCHSAIEKNEGCNRMPCSFCRHEFCWFVLGRLGKAWI